MKLSPITLTSEKRRKDEEKKKRQHANIHTTNDLPYDFDSL